MSLHLIGAPINLGYANPEVAKFPQLIRQHGLLDMLKANRLDYTDHGDIAVPNSTDLGTSNLKHLAAVTTFSRQLARTVADSITSSEDIPVVIGGDHSLGIGSVSGVAERRHVGVLWIDAHCDAHTPETTYTGWIYGMPVAAVCGLGHADLAGIGAQVDPKTVCVFGARYYELEEVDHLNQLGATLITMDDILHDGIGPSFDRALEVVSKGTEAIHVSLDLDSIDEGEAPGVTEPSKGMFTYREIIYLAHQLAKTGQVGSIDVCEYDYTKDIDNQTLHLAIELIAKLLGKDYSEYNSYLASNSVEER